MVNWGHVIHCPQYLNFKTLSCQSNLFRLRHFAVPCSRRMNKKQRENEQVPAKKEAICIQCRNTLYTENYAENLLTFGIILDNQRKDIS